ncbi:hypothetical protein N658DRAFT_501784 [Parathielavia hyrcaniae]|uniref:Uncharacterized protein n=1 Tax=Parathielavia hyrcaniae TaxID=113614 RepID=A0AAN6PQS7_9PEZI|nr:hypothetical protein N658DRAFT_501784 [Parathielavia hyrcaniae]
MSTGNNPDNWSTRPRRGSPVPSVSRHKNPHADLGAGKSEGAKNIEALNKERTQDLLYGIGAQFSAVVERPNNILEPDLLGP